MEETICNLCDADNAELVFVEKDRLMKLPGTFRLVRCRQCGLVYLNPRPTPKEMITFYPQEYDPYATAPQDEPSSISRLDRSYGDWKRVRAVMAARPQGQRLLDLGCATGNFLHMMQRSSQWQVKGVDPSPEATRYARERRGLDVFTGELTEARYPDGYFDVVTLWQVIEHLHDPKGTLSEIRRILKPGGLLLISTPNLQSWDARLFGRYWAGLDAPRHLYVFSSQTLGRLLNATGFRVDGMYNLNQYYSPFARSMQFWLDEHLGNEPLRRALIAGVRSRVARLVTLPAFALLSSFNRTFALTIFANRNE